VTAQPWTPAEAGARAELIVMGYTEAEAVAAMDEARRFPCRWAYTADRGACVVYNMPGGRWEVRDSRETEARIRAAAGARLEVETSRRDTDPGPSLAWPPSWWHSGGPARVAIIAPPSRSTVAWRVVTLIAGVGLVIGFALAAAFAVPVPRWAAIGNGLVLGVLLICGVLGRGPLR
jgi:hypothetical protein